jgi:hypothetical protein
MTPDLRNEHEEVLFVDQDHPLSDFTFDSTTGWYQSPTPYRVLIVLDRSTRPADLRWGMRLAVRLGWEVVQGKRWRHVRVLRVVPPAAARMDSATAGPTTEVEPTSLFTFLARAPRTDRPGGARGAVGRKALVDGEATEAHSITLPASAWRLVERLGGGNRSEGVRRLVEERQAVAEEGQAER